MATIRSGDKTALLIVDMQVDVMDQTWEEARIIKNAARAVEKARASEVPIIWIQHVAKKLAHGSPGWDLLPGLTPRPADIRLDKHFNSSFEQTALEETLLNLGVSHIVLAQLSRPNQSRCQHSRPGILIKQRYVNNVTLFPPFHNEYWAG